MPIFDTVPRGQYDELVKRLERAETMYDTLFVEYTKLRQTHSPVSPMRVIPGKPDSGERAVMAAEAVVRDPALAKIADNIREQNPELSEAAVLREAKRLNDIRRGAAVPASAGAVHEPPVR